MVLPGWLSIQAWMTCQSSVTPSPTAPQSLTTFTTPVGADPCAGAADRVLESWTSCLTETMQRLTGEHWPETAAIGNA